MEASRKGQGRGLILKLTIPLTLPFCPLQAILSMLQDMNFINNYKIDCPTLARCVPPALPSVCRQPWFLPPAVLYLHIHCPQPSGEGSFWNN